MLMARSPAVLIGVVASVVIAVQNQGAVLGFGWAAIRGAGGGLLAFCAGGRCVGRPVVRLRLADARARAAGGVVVRGARAGGGRG